MKEIYKNHIHTPPHLFSPNSKYFITGSTYNNLYWLKLEEAKNKLLEIMRIGFNKYDWNIEDWVILDNHYHLMANAPKDAETLSQIINNIHRFIAIWIKKTVPESKNYQPIMYNYWDTCITYEKSYFARLNYIWHNPVKHGYVKDPADWIFGSYHERLMSEKDYIIKIMKTCPYDKVNVKDDF